MEIMCQKGETSAPSSYDSVHTFRSLDMPGEQKRVDGLTLLLLLRQLLSI